jgi:L-lactate dehydrogenase complex protein LldG
MNARENILESIGWATTPAQPAAIAREAAALLDAPEKIRPDFSNHPLPALFSHQSETIGCTLERIPTLAQLPAAVALYLARHRLPPAIALQPAADLIALDWSPLTIHPTMSPNEAAGVGLANWGIAETGSVVFHSGPETPVLYHFLPLHHIVALRASTIVAYLEDYVSAAERAGPPPRNVNIVTGASGTTDIEGSYVRGAHGPGFLHVVLVENA